MMSTRVVMMASKNNLSLFANFCHKIAFQPTKPHAKQKTLCPFPEVNNYLALKFNQNKDYCYHCIRIN